MTNKVRLHIYYPVLPFHNLRFEGISRLLIHQINGLSQVQEHSYLATPPWIARELRFMSKEYGYDLSKVTIIFPKIDYILLPFVILLTKMRILKKSWLKLITTSFLLASSLVAMLFLRSEIVILSNIFIFFLLIKFKKQLLGKFKGIFYSILELEKTLLTRKANKLTDLNSDFWIVPSPHYISAKYLKCKHVVIVPDLMNSQFPSVFLPHNTAIQGRTMEVFISAHALITYSENVKNLQLGILDQRLEPKVFVVPNARIPQPSLKKQVEKSNLDLPKNYFFYSSQFRPYKNFSILFQALSIARDEIPEADFGLVTTGDVWKVASAKKLIEDLNLEDAVFVRRNINDDEMKRVHNSSICNISPAWEEGGFFYFPFSEAWQGDCPVLASETRANMESLRTNGVKTKYEFMFDPSDPWDLAKKMTFAYRNRESLFELQKQALSKIMDRNWSNVANEYIEIAMRL